MLNIAVVGCGNWGAKHLSAWSRLGCLRVACDSDSAILRRRKEEYRDVQIEPDFSALLTRDDIQGIVLATPAATHSDMALQALEAGKDVFVEKPLAMDCLSAERLIKTARKKNRILMVGHILEYHPAVRALHSLVQNADFGRIRYMHSSRMNRGIVRKEESVLWSFAPHDIDLMLRLAGAMPAAASSHNGFFLTSARADVTLTHLEFPGNIQGHIYVSWLYPFKVQQFVVVGEKQMAVFDDTRPWAEKIRLCTVNPENEALSGSLKGEFLKLEEHEPLLKECEHFKHCIETRENPRTDGESGLRVLQVLELALKSPGVMFAGKDLDMNKKTDYYLHPTAQIDSSASIGRDTKVWHFSHVSEGAKIGERCILGQNTFIGRGVNVGNGVKIQNNVSVYEGVTLEDDVFCGPSVVFTNVINPRSTVDRKHQFKPTRVKKGATLGANATILCGTTIGVCAFVAAGAVVTRDVPDYALTAGVPARQTGWVCSCGEKLSSQFVCKCARKYRLKERGELVPLIS